MEASGGAHEIVITAGRGVESWLVPAMLMRDAESGPPVCVLLIRDTALAGEDIVILSF